MPIQFCSFLISSTEPEGREEEKKRDESNAMQDDKLITQSRLVSLWSALAHFVLFLCLIETNLVRPEAENEICHNDICRTVSVPCPSRGNSRREQRRKGGNEGGVTWREGGNEGDRRRDLGYCYRRPQARAGGKPRSRTKEGRAE